MAEVVIPRLAGSRERAIRITESLPDQLQGMVVNVQADGVEAAAQSFADELCKQILEIRRASNLVVHCATAKFASYLNSSAQARGVSDRLSVDIRPA